MKKGKLNIKKRIVVTACLVNLLPLLIVLFYLSNSLGPKIHLSTLGAILFIGWLIILNMMLFSIAKIHRKTQTILQDIGEEKTIERLRIESEFQGLDSIFNVLSTKVKDSFHELQKMSSKIENLNQELTRKVNILLTIMQVHDIFSSNVEEDKTFRFILLRLKTLLLLDKIYILLFKKIEENFDVIIFSTEENTKIYPSLDEECLKILCKLKKNLIIDASHSSPENMIFLKDILKLQNIFVNPLYLKEEIMGFLIGGNFMDNFIFSQEDLELTDIFSKNIALIWQYIQLYSTVENLKIYDPLTGLYNKKYIQTRLDEEIKRAAIYQRPCGLFLMEVANLKEFQDKFGITEGNKLLRKISKIFKDSLRPIDIAARVAENRIAAILIERNKRQCQSMEEKIKTAFDDFFKEESFKPYLLFSTGENPLNGGNSEELFAYVSSHLKKYESEEKSN